MMREAIRASFLHFTDKPDPVAASGYDYYEDGIMVIKDGRIESLDHADRLLALLPDDVELDQSMRGKLIMPGMIDTHTHYPQVNIIAAYGEQLLDWLEKYTYPAEMRFGNTDYAESVADVFIQECLRNGTTTAMVYGTVHPESVQAFFKVSHQYNTRMIAGKVMMDRNAPEALLDNPEQSYQDSGDLIQQWHDKGRQSYAITPRFAPTSSPAQLQLAGQLKQAFPEVYVQTHVSENKQETEWVRELFPESESYLQVYQHYGLLSDKTIMGHGIYLDDAELAMAAEYGSSIAFCPTSNLFLGSGLLNLKRCESFGVDTCLATDVGAGTSFSMFRTMQAAYEVSQLKGYSIDPLQAFYTVTLGNAKSLKLDSMIGNFETGKEADFIVLDLQATELMRYRLASCQTLTEKLFVLMYLGDDRLVERTYIMGKRAHDKNK